MALLTVVVYLCWNIDEYIDSLSVFGLIGDI